MRVRTVPLLNKRSSTGWTSPWVSPELPRSMHDAVVAICVENVTGTPTTATISPTFQLWHSNTGGSFFENDQNASGLSPLNAWQTLSAAQNPSLLPDGDWPALLDVTGATTSTPVFVTRRISGGFPWRLRLAWAFTGGSTPAMDIDASVFIREVSAGGFDRVESGS